MKMCKPFVNDHVCLATFNTQYCPYSHDGLVKKAFLEAKKGYIDEDNMMKILSEDNPQESELT